MITASTLVAGGNIINSVTIHQYGENKRKQWRDLSTFHYPSSDVDHDLTTNWPGHLVVNLGRTFKERYVSFVAMFNSGSVSPDVLAAVGPGAPDKVITFTTNQAALVGGIESAVRTLYTSEHKRAFQQEYNAELARFSAEWTLHIDLVAPPVATAHRVTYDPDRKRIIVRPDITLSTNVEEYPEKLKTTTELLLFLGAIMHAGNVVLLHFPDRAVQHYPMIKLFAAFLDKEFRVESVRVNASDSDEWDYVSPKLDVEFAKAANRLTGG